MVGACPLPALPPLQAPAGSLLSLGPVTFHRGWGPAASQTSGEPLRLGGLERVGDDQRQVVWGPHSGPAGALRPPH